VSVNGSRILPDVIEESRRLSDVLEGQGIPVRLLGGLGIRLVAAAAYPPELAREYNDIDLVTDSRHGRQLAQSLAEQGYEPNQMFNRMHGARRLLFYDEPNKRQLDVFVGTFEMCHTLPIAERLDVVPLTLPAADLLLTKLQIVRLNEKDRNDAYALLLALEVGTHDDGAINAAWVARLCARDWGLYRTLQLNLEKLREATGATRYPYTYVRCSRWSKGRAALVGERTRIEASAGPIQYLAMMVGAAPEAAVRWLILLMVLCCDPAAIALTVAAASLRR